MSYSYDETYAVYNRMRRKARKPHVCCACDEAIRPGDVYEYVVTICLGDVETFKRCLRCDAIWEAIFAITDPNEEWVAERLDCGHDWKELHGDDPPEEVTRLAFLTADDAQRELAMPKEPA